MKVLKAPVVQTKKQKKNIAKLINDKCGNNSVECKTNMVLEMEWCVKISVSECSITFVSFLCLHVQLSIYACVNDVSLKDPDFVKLLLTVWLTQMVIKR